MCLVFKVFTNNDGLCINLQIAQPERNRGLTEYRYETALALIFTEYIPDIHTRSLPHPLPIPQGRATHLGNGPLVLRLSNGGGNSLSSGDKSACLPTIQ